MKLSLYDKLMLRARLVHHEADKDKPYLDTLGNWSIGIGHNLAAHGLPRKMIEELFEQDVQIAEEELRGFIWWHGLDTRRKGVLIELNFNMGMKSLLTFRKMLAAVEAGDFGKASDELVDSKWYVQVGEERGLHLATVLRTGKYQ